MGESVAAPWYPRPYPFWRKLKWNHFSLLLVHFTKVDDEILRSLVSSLCFTKSGVWTPSAIHMTPYFNTLAALRHPPPCHGVLGLNPYFVFFYSIFLWQDPVLHRVKREKTMDAFFKIMSCYNWVFLHWFLHCFIWISFGLLTGLSVCIVLLATMVGEPKEFGGTIGCYCITLYFSMGG